MSWVRSESRIPHICQNRPFSTLNHTWWYSWLSIDLTIWLFQHAGHPTSQSAYSMSGLSTSISTIFRRSWNLWQSAWLGSPAAPTQSSMVGSICRSDQCCDVCVRRGSRVITEITRSRCLVQHRPWAWLFVRWRCDVGMEKEWGLWKDWRHLWPTICRLRCAVLRACKLFVLASVIWSWRVYSEPLRESQKENPTVKPCGCRCRGAYFGRVKRYRQTSVEQLNCNFNVSNNFWFSLH